MSIPIQTLSASAAGNASPLAEASASSLGKDEFLKLLVGQLRNQSPLSPVGDQEFISQMTAFSTLEQVTNLAASNARLENTLAANQSIALIGHQVTFAKEDGSTVEGLVEHISFDEEGFTLTVNGESGVLPGAIAEVR